MRVVGFWMFIIYLSVAGRWRHPQGESTTQIESPFCGWIRFKLNLLFVGSPHALVIKCPIQERDDVIITVRVKLRSCDKARENINFAAWFVFQWTRLNFKVRYKPYPWSTLIPPAFYCAVWFCLFSELLFAVLAVYGCGTSASVLLCRGSCRS